MKKLALLLIVTSALFSCSSEKEIIEKEDPYADCKAQIKEYTVSMADPKTGLIEGDIIPDIQVKGLVSGDKTWPNRIIPYYFKAYVPGSIDNGFRREEDKDLVRLQLTNLGIKANFLFIEFDNKYRLLNEYDNGVQITAAAFIASSHVGMQPTPIQVVKLYQGGEDYVVEHEFGHTLGLEHEFNRPDRDQYLKFNFDNIYESAWPQFRINLEAISCGPFNPESVMMYRPDGYAINPEIPTFTLANGEPFVYSEAWSEGDTKTLDTKY